MNQSAQSDSYSISHPNSIAKIRTLIEGFDDISHGGLPVGRTTLVSGTSGTGKTLMVVQFLYLGIIHFEESGVF
ncbi:MAG: circadian clock protein KaiC, partial [Leptolyngbya sp. SIO1D8]|nr:circadian clock protein KaiC [Leptolyngbya sp. SIO1D8]